jgi:hypothetical protein
MKAIPSLCMTISALIASAFSITEAQPIPDFTPMPMLTKTTGTGCGPCGSWGWTQMHDAVVTHGAYTLIMSSYDPYYNYNGSGETPLHNNYAIAWSKNFKVGGFPTFTVNTTNEGAPFNTGINTHRATTPKVGLNFKAWVEGNVIKVARYVQSKTALSGTYSLSTILLEDSVMHVQASQTGKVPHHYVLRAMPNTKQRGDTLAAKAVSGNLYIDTVSISMSTTDNPAWNKSKFKIGLVLWNGTNFVNAYTRSKSETFKEFSSDPFVQVNSIGNAIEVEQNIDLTWSTNITSGNAVITLLKNNVVVKNLATVPVTSSTYSWKVDNANLGTGFQIQIVAGGKTSLSNSFSINPKTNIYDQNKISIETFSSQEITDESAAATNVLDGNASTIWHSGYSSSEVPPPHEFIFKTSSTITMLGVQVQARQVGTNGIIKDYEIYTSNDKTNWTLAKNGAFEKILTPQKAIFDQSKTAQYIKFVIKSAHNGEVFGSMSEFNILYEPAAVKNLNSLKKVKMTTTELSGFEANAFVKFYNLQGKVITSQKTDDNGVLKDYKKSLHSGIYLVEQNGINVQNILIP